MQDDAATPFPCNVSRAGEVTFEVLAAPGSSRSAVRGVHGTALKVSVQAPPEKGKANQEIEALLARFLGISKKSVSVVSGKTSRRKRIRVRGISARALRAKLA